MDALRPHLSKIRVPTKSQSIYKDECMYSFDTPETPTGLYVSLTTFFGFGEEYVRRYAEMTGNAVFLHIQRKKILKEDSNTSDKTESAKDEGGPERKITRLAIGVEGGFNDVNKNRYDYINTYSIVVMPNISIKIPYPNPELPMIVTQAVEAVLLFDSAISKLNKENITGTWDGEIRQISKFSDNLQQLNTGKKIPPSGWKCEKCDLTSNLWLNLTDGSILCGRKFFDGSGGNDHAVQHYKEMGYPLAVKLGTITADGKSDVFSYPEDDMVIDSNLEKHLAHFGINMAAMKKSEKSMVELELEINQRIGEWSLLTESNSELQPLSGPGYTGMRNLGNSCYINSVMQVLFTIPDFQTRFVGDGARKYFDEFPSDPANNFNIQLAKLGNGLCSGKYSSIAENTLESEETGISPNMFKNVIGKNHADFSTKMQQDAFDFYLHLANLFERNSRNDINPMDALAFCVEDRIECMASGKVRYTRRQEYGLPLQIPLDKATNLDEVKEYLDSKTNTLEQNTSDKDVVRHKVPLKACLDRFFAPEIIESFYSTAINGNTTAKKTTRLASMPDFLLMHLRKFMLGNDWVPKKLDVSMDMPDEIDLSNWRATGLQPGEQELPDTKSTAPAIVYDVAVMNELIQMGFPHEACKRALYNTNNSGLEAASNWLMDHIGDLDISEPFVEPVSNTTTNEYVPNQEALMQLMTMGFDKQQAIKALKATDGNVERATDWIFSHLDDMDTNDASVQTEEQNRRNDQQLANKGKSYRDGGGKYKLMAFISHMGTSAQVGHYVCHIRKDGQWVIYNDSRVALSQNPPKDLGYLYIYKRVK